MRFPHGSLRYFVVYRLSSSFRVRRVFGARLYSANS